MPINHPMTDAYQSINGRCLSALRTLNEETHTHTHMASTGDTVAKARKLIFYDLPLGFAKPGATNRDKNSVHCRRAKNSY